eukprot:NODE_4451_length_1061_cov_122.013859_g4250_i0.p1 GENE.NODE_4451_length_1061_cov_122.013859_g4250_i0~~NODE_4451_length_1061_cov_122.013859_g4250_i0.p1  ORF type:complete len:297 (+),score=13.22 NODE_4451_length_1061_cov_122.013859_g4250_i0:123-1013(+)
MKPPPLSMSKWMETLATQIGDRRICEVAMPGSHDSATYDITMARDYIPCHKGPPGPLASIFRKDAVEWSRAQRVSVRQQLDHGSRYIDLRVIYDPYKTPALWSCHGLYGSPMEEVFKDIQQFMETHTREIILIDCPEYHQVGMCVDGHQMDDDGHAEYLNMMERFLGKWLRSVSKCVRLMPSTMSAAMTVNEVWRTPYRAIVMYRHPVVATSRTWLWPREAVSRSDWKNKCELKLLIAELVDEVAQNRPTKPMFWGLQSILTPTPGATIKAHCAPLLSPAEPWFRPEHPRGSFRTE